ncbi:hypothetical protein [Streptomyces sp. NBC_00457]
MPCDSGKISGNQRRPQGYNRRLQGGFYMGKRHNQAVLAHACRRVNVP